jgi:hypothetical protein
LRILKGDVPSCQPGRISGHEGAGIIDKADPATKAEWTQAEEAPRGSAMDQYRDLGMRQHLDRLAAEDDRGDTVAAV